MKNRQWLTIAMVAGAVLLAGAYLFPRSKAEAQTAKSKTPIATVQNEPNMAGQDPARPDMGGQGMGGPGMMGGQGMGNPGMMGGQGMGNPGMMGGQGMGNPGMMRPGMMGMGMSPVMAATNEYVYVLRGNTLYQFSARDLKQLHKVELDQGVAGRRPRLPMDRQDGNMNPPEPGE